MENKKKSKIPLIIGIAVLVLGAAVLIIGLLMPPPGEIHNSVVMAFGEALTFSGAVLGIREGGA
ncbi:MAG: hypothetical protein NC204_02610 [Candidatus Amulumruptor caecigallinarius]|nr:hypothetical protein [Candidatus Amulumruptor caecigallinarius]